MKPQYIIITILWLFLTIGCKKDWLDAKSNISLAVPATLDDFQKILDNDRIFNSSHPYLAELSADNYFIQQTVFDASSVIRKNSYIWAVDQYPGQSEAVAGGGINDWFYPYQRIFYANTVLDGLSKIPSDNSIKFNNIKGSALFYRAFQYYILAQEFAPSYNSVTANADLGLPLKLTADINEKVARSTVEQTYNRIIEDLNTAVDILPEKVDFPTKPTKQAAYALLSRVYLNKQDYKTAGDYADLCLKINGKLLDYNALSTTASFPFARFNEEVIYHTATATGQPFAAASTFIDDNLYKSYNTDDLRKVLFFKETAGLAVFKGSYFGSSLPFSGIATDEMYLTRAECYARQNNAIAALADLNTLMKKRWRNTVTYPIITAVDATEALAKILTERRKELVFRGVRWTDLRRLNLIGANITLTRNINSQTYTLPPNDKRYTFAIPDQEIAQSGIEQNIRR